MSKTKDLKELINEAKKLAREGIVREEKSLIVNAEIIKLDKYNSAAYCRLGRYFEEKGDLLQARKAFRNASIIDSKHQGYQNALNRIEKRLKEEADRKLIEKIENYKEAHEIGMAAKESCDYKLAILALEKSIELEPTIYAKIALAASYRTIGKLDVAEKIYRDVLGEEKSVCAMTGLAAVLKDKKKFKEAERILAEASKIKENDFYILRTAASVYSSMKQKGKAKEYYRMSFKSDLENL